MKRLITAESSNAEKTGSHKFIPFNLTMMNERSEPKTPNEETIDAIKEARVIETEKIDVFAMLNAQEIIQGSHLVREACRKFMLKRTHAGTLPTVRKMVPKKWTLEAWNKQGGICPRCKQTILNSEMSGDHIKPLADGGTHNRWNIQCLHARCNSSKGANNFVKESKLAQVGKTLHVNDEKYTRVPIEEEA